MTTEDQWKKIREEETREEEPMKCPECKSEDVVIKNWSYEDDHHEMIEGYLVCNDCGYSDI